MNITVLAFVIWAFLATVLLAATLGTESNFAKAGFGQTRRTGAACLPNRWMIVFALFAAVIIYFLLS